MIGTGSADFFWTLYVTHIAKINMWRAAFYSSCIILIEGSIVVGYVSDSRLVIPAAAGAFIGTFIPLWKKSKNKKAREINEQTSDRDT